jgi:TonB family protein
MCVALLLYAALTKAEKSPRPQPVSLRAIDLHRWELNRGRFGPPLPLPPRRFAPQPAPLPIGQVVDVARGNGEVDPNAQYLAESNNRVRKQTRARVQTATRAASTPSTRSSEPKPERQTPSPAQSLVAERERLDRLLDAEGGRRFSLLGAREEGPPAAAAQEATPETSDTPAAEGGGGSSADDLAQLEAGDGTFLNTREWKYAAFFNRLKQAVGAHWDPGGRLHSRDPAGRRFGALDRLTVVDVTLRPDGSLYQIFVAQTSGLDFLDQEAVHAFEQAQPFMNPPAGLVRDGYVHFAFGFKLSNDGTSGLPHMFRFGR